MHCGSIHLTTMCKEQNHELTFHVRDFEARSVNVEYFEYDMKKLFALEINNTGFVTK